MCPCRTCLWFGLCMKSFGTDIKTLCRFSLSLSLLLLFLPFSPSFSPPLSLSPPYSPPPSSSSLSPSHLLTLSPSLSPSSLSLSLPFSLSPPSPYTPLYSAHCLQSRLPGVRLPGETRSVQCAALPAELLGLSPPFPPCRAPGCRAAARALPRGRSLM